MPIFKHRTKNKRRRRLTGFVLLFGLILPCSAAVAAEQQVTVTIPTFDVTLNDRMMDGTYSKYPLLIYKDITYFPMTYYDSRLLGVKADWSADDGLVVTKEDGYFYEYMREINEKKNNSRLTAKIAEGKITVNGKAIDNTKEEYPLLVCRDVTYFPLTWRFAAEEFGWDYDFTQEKGLVIRNDGVKLEDPKKWTEDALYPFSGGAGSDYGAYKLVFPISLNYPNERVYSLSEALAIPDGNDNPLKNDLVSYGTRIYNIYYGQDVIIQPMEQWEYQVCRIINEQQEILYWRKFPFYTGRLPEGHFAAQGASDLPIWSSGIIKEGEYRLQLVPSGDIVYEEANTHTIKQVSTDECFLKEDDVGKYYSSIKLLIKE